MLNPKVSLIVPVYKVEDYIERCIQSILSQIFSDFELILVDDGSPDKCGEICDKYAKEDERIKVIHQENAGVSMARNAGIEVATGEYISFLDPDDSMQWDFIERLVKIAEENECDIVSSKFYSSDKDTVTADNVWIKAVDRLVEKEEFLTDVLTQLYRGFDCPVWNKLFKTEIIKTNEIKFDKTLFIGEDYKFNLEYMKYVSKYFYDTQGGYYYRVMSENSAMKNQRPGFVDNFMKLYIYKEKSLSFYDKQYRLNLQRCNALWLFDVNMDHQLSKTGEHQFRLKLLKQFAREVLKKVKRQVGNKYDES